MGIEDFVMKDISKLDKIIITKDELDLLFKWRNNHMEYVRAFKPVLTEGMIIIGDTHMQTFEEVDNMWIYNVYYNDNVVHTLAWRKDTKEGYTVKSVLKVDEKEYNSSIISLHASLMAYMEYYSDKKEYVERKEVKSMVQRKSKSKSKNKKKSPIRIKKVVYNVKVNKESIAVDRKRYERQVDKWTVRGHWREYKGGKKVWIKPYVKGEGEKITPKDYRL